MSCPCFWAMVLPKECYDMAGYISVVEYLLNLHESLGFNLLANAYSHIQF